MAHPGPAGALSYAATVFGTAWLGWLGFAAVGGGAGEPGWFAWCWYVPLPYFGAWFAFALPSAWLSLVLITVLAPANLLLAGAGFVVGMVSAGALGLPAFLAAGGLFGRAAAWLQAGILRAEDPAPGRRTHVLGGIGAGAGLFWFALLVQIKPWHWPSPVLRYVVLLSVLSLGFAWHAVPTWRRLAEAGEATCGRGLRMAVLLCLAYAVPILPWWPANQHRWTPLWPADLLRREAAAVRQEVRREEEQRREAQATFNEWLTTEGRTLGAGEHIVLTLAGSERIALAAPDGWHVRAGPNWFILRPETGRRAGPATQDRLEVRGGRAPSVEALPLDRAMPLDRGGRRPTPFLCSIGLPTLPGLIACRSPDRPVPGGAAETVGRLFDAPAREVWVALGGLGRSASFSAFGEGFAADCYGATSCTARFPFAHGAAGVTAWLPREALPRWRAIRLQVDDLLRAATGQGLDDTPALLQPEGEILPLSGR